MAAIFPLSIMPASPAATAPAPAHGAESATAASFLTQLESSLAGLASAALAQLAAPTAGEPHLAGQPAPLPGGSSDRQKQIDSALSDAMPEVLAGLGLLALPTVLPQPIAPESVGVDGSGSAPPALATTSTTMSSEPLAQTATLARSSATDSAAPAGAATSSLPSPAAPAGQLAAPSASSALPLDSSSLRAAPAAAQASSSATATIAQSAPAPSHHAPTTAIEPTAAPTLAALGQDAAGQNAQADTSGSNSNPAPSEHTPIQHGPSSRQPVFDAVAAAAGAGAAPIPTPMPAHVRPSEVVAQIAQQAELYRLPVNRGVRVQLHPEDLGGVDVTLRYSATGGIQLHIDVEHAATAKLVQSGWTELRDALATQGISPDRLVLSITGPNGGGSPDFSPGGDPNLNRPDPSLAGFPQGQSSGQQRQDAEDPRSARRWNLGPEPMLAPAEDGPRLASAASGHIDYRV